MIGGRFQQKHTNFKKRDKWKCSEWKHNIRDEKFPLWVDQHTVHREKRSVERLFNTHLFEVPDREERVNRAEKICKEIMAKISKINARRKKKSQIQQCQRSKRMKKYKGKDIHIHIHPNQIAKI